MRQPASLFGKTALTVAAAFILMQALVLAILTSTGLVQTWHVVLCALALGVINAFDRPARQSRAQDRVNGSVKRTCQTRGHPVGPAFT